MAEPALSAVETPSGKDRGDENFPVGSFLIRRDLRVHVHAFYRFARQADDIADNGELSAEEKIRRLDRMGEVLEGAPSNIKGGDDAPSASAMRASLAATGVTAQHSHDVLTAFKMDAVKPRYADWDELMHYCRYSASPVGRQLLDLHGEDRNTWPSSDALCSALQVLNHLQDCAADLADLDRCYLPEPWLKAEGSSIDDLRQPQSSPGLRRVIDRLLDGTDKLIIEAQALPGLVKARGLSRECAVIVNLATRLARRLRHGDPLAMRVKLSKADFLLATLTGLIQGGRG